MEQTTTKQMAMEQITTKQTAAQESDYGNWIPKTLMRMGWSVSAALLFLGLLSGFLWKNQLAAAIFLILFLLETAMTAYMSLCRRAFSFNGGNVMRNIHRHLLTRLTWNGKGQLVDIGCGSGALTILSARTYPKARITGIDFWGKEWNYAKEQCEENARLEHVSPIRFLQGDAASLPFGDGAFDAAVSNFVFHEVKSQPYKRLVVREALRVVKKGGAFAFHDLFEQKHLYGNMEEFISILKAEGITEIHYDAHTERLSIIPWYVKAPWLLKDMGIIYGVK